MVGRERGEAAAVYDRLSRWYDLLADASERPFREQGLELLDAGPGERVLEFGFGTGHALVHLAEAVGPSGAVVGVDISAGMARQAQNRLRREGQQGAVDLVIGDGVRAPLRSDSFDAVFMSFTLELFARDDISRVLRQCRRVLRAGGRLCVVSMATTEDPSLMQRLYVAAHRQVPKWLDCRPIPVERWLSDAGFELRRVEEGTMWGLAVTVALAEHHL